MTELIYQALDKNVEARIVALDNSKPWFGMLAFFAIWKTMLFPVEYLTWSDLS